MTPVHILHLGGDTKYLPLARSKLQALASRVGDTGHASEKLIIDSTTLLIEVNAGIHRVTIMGANPVFMDSGALDIKTVTLGDPAIGEGDGTIHYNTAITLQAQDKKLLGAIDVSTLRCNPPADGSVSRSFKVKVVDGERDGTSVGQLVLKKTCSKLVPPSLFTGKMRLFFQAKYGGALDEWAFTVNTDNQPPSLDATVKTTAFQFHPARCGIYTDSRMNHWFVQIDLDGDQASQGLTIFRMRASDSVQMLRSMLLDTDRSQQERERIEAYVLSQSMPDPDYKISIPLDLPHGVSMGYGWHFNWSGTSIDIVTHDAQPFGAHFQYFAQHHRITLARSDLDYAQDLATEPARWSASVAVVESQTWGNHKWKTVITYPDWQSQELSVFGSTLGFRAGNGAPVYCFWRREGFAEVFEMVRYSYTAPVTGNRWKIDSDPPYFYGIVPEQSGVTGVSPCIVQFMTVGLEDATTETTSYPETATTSSFSATSSAVSVSARNSTVGGTYSGPKIAPDAGVNTGTQTATNALPIKNGMNPPVADLVEPNTNFCPVGYINAHGSITGYTPFIGTYTQNACIPQWTEYTYTKSIEQDMQTLMVIPFGDAEAVYLWGQNYHKETRTNVSSRTFNDSLLPSYRCANFMRIVNGSDVYTWVDYHGMYRSEYTPSAPVADGSTFVTPEESLWTSVGSVCICNAGVVQADISPGSQFFAGDPTESVEQQFYTAASVGGDVRGQGIELTGGYHASIDDAPFVFVGWA